MNRLLAIATSIAIPIYVYVHIAIHTENNIKLIEVAYVITYIANIMPAL